MSVNAHILVDANVAKSATEPANNPVTERCMLIARTLGDRACQTGIAMTPMLFNEWQRHATKTMSRWLAMMETRGRIRDEPDRRVADLRKVINAVTDDGVRLALEKDAHISEAAILYSLPVASHDKKQRKYLVGLAPEYARLSKLQWMDPVEDSPDQWVPWLKDGCQGSDEYACHFAS